MNKIIGGLLVISLLSRPSAFNIHYLAYELFLKEKKIVCVIKSENEDENKLAWEKGISEMMACIHDNTRGISSLLKEKNKVFAKIETNLDLLRYAKVNLNEQQIDSFAKFMQFSEQQNAILSETLQKIEDNRDLGEVKKELLHNHTDYAFIYDELNDISVYQKDALACLNAMVEEGNNMLNLL